MLIGSFTKKVMEKRKPRPYEIINNNTGKTGDTKNPMSSRPGSVKSSPMHTDVAGHTDPYSMQKRMRAGQADGGAAKKL